MEFFDVGRKRRMNSLVSKLQDIEKIKEIQWLAPCGKAASTYDGVLESIRAEYCSLFRTFIFEEIGLNFCNDEDLNNSLRDISNALKSTILKGIPRIVMLKKNFGVTCVSDNSLVQILFYMLNDKKLISYKKGESINRSTLTENGIVVLALLEEYLKQNPVKEAPEIVLPEYKPKLNFRPRQILDDSDGDCLDDSDGDWDGIVY